MPPKDKRAYVSPLRERQAATTRDRIVAAAITLLAEHPETELSHETVALAAGIATRTVYRHFPSRSRLLDSIWDEIDQRLGLSTLPTSGSAELLAAIPNLFALLDANAAIVNALITTHAGHEMSLRTGDRRLRAIEAALADDTRGMARAERDRLIGLVRVLTSPMTWHVLRQKTRVTGNEPARAVVWAIEQLLGVGQRSAGA